MYSSEVVFPSTLQDINPAYYPLSIKTWGILCKLNPQVSALKDYKQVQVNGVLFMPGFVVSSLFIVKARAKRGSLSAGWMKKWNAFSPFLLKKVWNPQIIWLNELFALEFCGGREVRVPEVIKDAVGWSEFCPCAILVNSNAGPLQCPCGCVLCLFQGTKT